MATKAELERQSSTCKAIVGQTKEALSKHQYSTALDLAVQSFPFIDGMIQYERRYEQVQNQKFPTLETILSFAPVLFRWRMIHEVESFLNNTKRIEKNSETDWRKKIEHSRLLLNHALILWEDIKSHVTAIPGQDTVNPVDRLFVLGSWERMGYVTKPKSGPYVFVSDLESRTRAKCPKCGDVCDATKETFLSELKCPRCSAASHFVILGPVFKKGE